MINILNLNRTNQLPNSSAIFAQKIYRQLFYSFSNIQNWIKNEIIHPVDQKVRQKCNGFLGLRDLSQCTLLEKKNGVIYYLWQNTSFDVNRTTYVVTHGWCSGGARDGDFQDLLVAIKNHIPDANVIFVDWTEYANHLNYTFVKKNTLKVGALLGDFLANLGVNSSKVSLIGHSLGAHILGNAGASYAEQTGNAINTIIALEPAGPLFKDTSKCQRLDDGDAEHVIAFHSTTIFGYSEMIGDVDIFLNDWINSKQPGASGIMALKSSHTYPILVLADLLKGKTFQQRDHSFLSLNSLYDWSGSYHCTTQ
ncbi:MAG: hypothetical protein AAGA83_00870 [Cyanobacteria bacterium P01_F01_bin.116]